MAKWTVLERKPSNAKVPPLTLNGSPVKLVWNGTYAVNSAGKAVKLGTKPQSKRFQ